MRDERLRERANLSQLVVGLSGREVARHPTPMIRASWSPVNESSNDALPGTRCRRPVPCARRSRSSSGRGRAIWLAALIALLTLEPMRNPKAPRWDDPTLTHDLGAVTDVWARWDSVHFLRIAEHGYSSAEAAFYPLYPGLVAGLGRALGGHYIARGDRVVARGRARLLRAAGTHRRGAARRQTARGGRSSTSRSFRRHSSSRPSTRSRSSSFSASAPSCLPNAGGFAGPASSSGLPS